MKPIALCLAAALTLAGCRGAQQMALGDFSGDADWYNRPGLTRERFEADRDAAEMQALRDPNLRTVSMRKSAVANALRDQGYTIVRAKDAPGDWARYPPR